jgi:hypothetical protein
MKSDKRNLKDFELSLIMHLLSKSSFMIPYDLEKELQVVDMNDGGMGSLLLFPKNVSENKRDFGKQIAECVFKDLDDVIVTAVLNVDKNNELFELDIWKTDFSRLIQIPKKIS